MPHLVATNKSKNNLKTSPIFTESTNQIVNGKRVQFKRKQAVKQLKFQRQYPHDYGWSEVPID